MMPLLCPAALQISAPEAVEQRSLALVAMSVLPLTQVLAGLLMVMVPPAGFVVVSRAAHG
jgi:hypothetical protein